MQELRLKATPSLHNADSEWAPRSRLAMDRRGPAPGGQPLESLGVSCLTTPSPPPFPHSVPPHSQIARLRSELDVVRGNTKVMSEMLTEMVPGQEDSSDLELLQVSRGTPSCRTGLSCSPGWPEVGQRLVEQFFLICLAYVFFLILNAVITCTPTK